ncbi:MAG: DUF2238 domain-containing protein [Bacteroidia bacterium]|jgi:putative membrane protein
MKWTTAFSKGRPDFRQNKILQVYLLLFGLFWIYTVTHTTDLINWCIENTLTVLSLSVLAFTYKRFKFSDLSYSFIFLFTIMHVYGSQYTYAENPLGFRIQELLDLKRNHYDRIVHTSFGLLAWYPLFDFFRNHFQWPEWVCKVLPINLLLSFSALYEIVEWAVAEVFFPAQGMAYLGTQGDVWDGVKDMVLAFSGSVLGLTLFSLFRVKKR